MTSIAVAREGGVLVLTLAHAPVNALDDALLARLDAVLDDALADAGIVVLHLRSALEVFSAGADLALLHERMASDAGRAAMVETVRRMQRLFARLESAPLVTLAEIGGAALGGGFELALACDLRIAAHEARLGLPEAGLGLLAAAGGTQRLTRLAGPGIAKRLLLGAETLKGDAAAALGLVQWTVPASGLAASARAHAQRLAALPASALAAAKSCIAAAAGPDGFALEIELTRSLYAHPVAQQRVAAFLQRRRTA